MARLAASQRGAGNSDADADTAAESKSGSLFAHLAAAGANAPNAAPNQGQGSGGVAVRVMRPAAPPVAGYAALLSLWPNPTGYDDALRVRRVRGRLRPHRERYFGRIRGVLKSRTGDYRRAGFIWSPELDSASLFREGAADKLAAISFGMAVSFTAKSTRNVDRSGDVKARSAATCALRARPRACVSWSP